MILVSVMYPNVEGAKFDYDYYLSHHIPLVKKHWSDSGLEKVRVFKGESGSGPMEKPGYILMAMLEFASHDALQACLAKAGDEVMGDVAKFTTIEPVLQVSEPLA